MSSESESRSDLILGIFIAPALLASLAFYAVWKFDLLPYGTIQTAANESKDKRDAQNLASVCSSAIAARSDELGLVTSEWAAVAVLRRGTYGGDSFASTLF